MTRSSTRIAVAAAAGTLLATLAAGGAQAAPAIVPTVVEVAASDIAATRPATGGWFFDNDGTTDDGHFVVAKDGPGNDPAMKLGVPTSTDKVYLYNTFGPGSRPTDIPALLPGASYDYAGVNVNFQIELIFKPLDVASYGPAGTVAACTSAATWYGWGLTADPDWCYTVLKWEPYVSPGTAAWTHVDLSVDTAAHSASKTGGWVSSKNLGSYPGNVSVGQLMATYLAAIEEYEVTSFAFGIGSGTPGPAYGYLKEYTIGGTTYRFVPEPTTPAAPPAADTDELEDLIADEGLDPETETEQFVTTGAVNTDLSQIDAALPLDGAYENWKDPADAFVDVYTYSTPVFIGTFPVVNGDVVLTGADLSHLEPGVHHFLFRGQTTGALAVVRFTVIGLAATGQDAEATMIGAGAAGLLLAAGAGLLVAARRRRRGRHTA